MYPYDNYGNQPYQQPAPTFNQPYMSAQNSNIIKVTSLDEAIMRTNLRNCEMAYFDQNGKAIYIVRVDGVGNKSWDVLSCGTANANMATPATKEELLALVERIEVLEKRGLGEQNVQFKQQ